MSGQTLATTSLPTIEEVRAAQELVYSVTQPTAQVAWPLLCERLGTEVRVKHENHTPIGAFKAPTAVVYAAELFRGSNNIKGFGDCHARQSRPVRRAGCAPVQRAGSRRRSAGK